MAMIGVSSAMPRKTAILPEGGRDFLRRRMMELVGVGVAAAGVVLLLALFTYSPGDPSLNHATGRAPHNLVGVFGAYVSDLGNTCRRHHLHHAIFIVFQLFCDAINIVGIFI